MSTARVNYIYGATVDLVVVECYKCAVPFGLPKALDDECHKDHSRSFYCPNGHGQVYTGETEAQKLARQLKWAKDSEAAARARADGAEASLRTTKGHVTRLRKQVLAGQCPFCGQHLRDLERHIGRVHADEPAEAPE